MNEDPMPKNLCQWCNTALTDSGTNCPKCGTAIGLTYRESEETEESLPPILEKFYTILSKALMIVGFLIWLGLGPGLLIFGIVSFYQGNVGIENMKGNNPAYGLQVVMGVITGIIGLLVTTLGAYGFRKDRDENRQ